MLVSPFLGGCLRNCKALARAFSCVLTNCAKFYAQSAAILRNAGMTNESWACYLDKDLSILRVHAEQYIRAARG